MKTTLYTLTCLLSWMTLQAQENTALPITLLNPSFEDLPGMGKVPVCWTGCGFAEETPPDVQPLPWFPLTALPHHGTTYLGLVTRDNNTWEAIGQKLVKPMQEGQCYRMSFYAARSEEYPSMSRVTGQPVNFNRPVRLRIWAGADACETRQLLAETPTVNHLDWRSYTIQFQAQEAHGYLLLEACYGREDSLIYGGNVLLDALTPLTPVDCDQMVPAFPDPAADYRLTGKVNERALRFFHYPKPQYWENLEQVLPRYSRDIAFDQNLQLEKGHYYNADKELVLQNPYFDHLIRLLKKKSHGQLLMAVPGHNELAEKLKIEDVQAALRFFEAPMDRVQVMPWSKADQTLGWMGARDGILMCIVE